MSVRCTSVTLPTGSKRRRSVLRQALLREARVQPPGTSAAVAAATWRNSRLEIIGSAFEISASFRARRSATRNP